MGRLAVSTRAESRSWSVGQTGQGIFETLLSRGLRERDDNNRHGGARRSIINDYGWVVVLVRSGLVCIFVISSLTTGNRFILLFTRVPSLLVFAIVCTGTVYGQRDGEYRSRCRSGRFLEHVTRSPLVLCSNAPGDIYIQPRTRWFCHTIPWLLS